MGNKRIKSLPIYSDSFKLAVPLDLPALKYRFAGVVLGSSDY
jgi:hypothetical protein